MKYLLIVMIIIIERDAAKTLWCDTGSAARKRLLSELEYDVVLKKFDAFVDSMPNIEERSWLEF